MDGLTIGEAGARTGWSPRMLRYLERKHLVRPSRTDARYRLYGVRELNQLRSLGELRRRFGVEITEVAFAARLRSDPALGAAIETWLTGAEAGSPDTGTPAWVEWEQRKHERLLAA
ncbi:MAG: MerR family transcriptional regulator [Actinomycetota bacterium]|nr:MerR family transcriptional regulator [Actinomycetota bacterium]